MSVHNQSEPVTKMLAIPALTDQQVASFDENGCLFLPGAFGAADTEAIRRWTDEVAALPEKPGRHWVFHETSRIDGATDLINRIEYISPFHDGFKQLTEALNGAVAQLFGDEAVLFKEKINFKMPGGEGFEPHQDSQAGWEDYASNFISVMVGIDEATVANGCLEVAPGHHRRGLLRGMEPLTDADMVGMEFRHFPTAPGDVIFFDAYVPHRSAPNDTGATRRLYFATYNRASEGDHLERYYADKHETFPPDIEREAGKEYVYKI